MKAKRLGISGKNMAAAFLKTKGFTMLKNNFAVHGGEIDLIAEDKEVVVFVEVKTRKSDSFGFGDEQLTYNKRRRLRRAIDRYLAKYFSGGDPDWRVDLVEIVLDEMTGVLKEIEHYEDVEL
jgi:putative endonuclease